MIWSINQQYVNFSLTKFESSALDTEKDFSPLLSERASCLAKDPTTVDNKTWFQTQTSNSKVEDEVLALLRNRFEQSAFKHNIKKHTIYTMLLN